MADPAVRDPVQGLSRWYDTLERFRSRTPLWKGRVVVGLALLAVFLLDYLSRPITMSLLYGLIVLSAAWLEGESGVVWTTCASVVLDSTADSLGGVVLDREHLINEGIRVLLWLLIGSMAVVLKARVQLAEERRRDLQRAYRQIREDVEGAERVQEAFMDRPVPAHPSVELQVRRLVARRLGGDFYDLSIEDDLLRVLVADVSGKGSPAALVTGLLRGALNDVRREASEPSDVLRLLNRIIEAHVPTGMFVTCFYACLDLRHGELMYSSAGHEPALLRRADGLEALPATGIPLGIEPDEEFRQQRLSLRPGDLLLVYTDGLVDSRSPGGKRLDLEGVQDVLRLRLDAAGLASRLERIVRDREGKEPKDDVIILAASWRP